ncbi:MAG TPA: response regulator [Myxococcaceae bacterium]|nr:response regulator [Myxococcaceae bacterium]
MSVVLVADDEPAVLDALSQVVEDLGHQVVRAHDGREALQLARAQKPHLVVTDHMMPRLSGLDLVRQLREDDGLRDVPVLLLSAALPLGSVSEAKAFLPKPFELSEFEELVSTLLAESKAKAPPVADVRAEPPAGAEDQLHWLTRQVAGPLAEIRDRLGLLQLPSSEGMRHQVKEIERALGEVERAVRQVAPTKH